MTKKKHEANETALKALGVGLLTASVSWINSDPVSAVLAGFAGIGCLYAATHYRNIKVPFSKEGAKKIIDQAGDYIEEKIEK